MYGYAWQKRFLYLEVCDQEKNISIYLAILKNPDKENKNLKSVIISYKALPGLAMQPQAICLLEAKKKTVSISYSLCKSQ